jgi:predicted PurR-regulated permease PerM
MDPAHDSLAFWKDGLSRACFSVALLAGLELATAWGVIAFVLNYIPFIGPLVATVFLFAIAQASYWLSELC